MEKTRCKRKCRKENRLVIGENSRSEKTREDKTQKGNEANADGDNTIRHIGKVIIITVYTFSTILIVIFLTNIHFNISSNLPTCLSTCNDAAIVSIQNRLHNILHSY